MIGRHRAWHKQFKLMKLVTRIDWDFENVFVEGKKAPGLENRQQWNFNNIDLLLYTGLKDIDGKHVCEGDILTLDLERTFNFKVILDDREAAFKLVQLNNDPSGFYFGAIGICPTKILGNIYENPELLEIQ